MRYIILLAIFCTTAITAHAQDSTASSAPPPAKVGDVIIEKDVDVLISADWKRELDIKYKTAQQFEQNITPVVVQDINIQWLPEKKGLMIYNADITGPLYVLHLLKDKKDKLNVTKVVKIADNLDSKIAMVKAMIWLTDRNVITCELEDLNFQAPELKGAGLTPKKLKIKGFKTASMREAGFQLNELIADFSISSLRVAGYTASEFRALNFDVFKLRMGGFSTDELKEAGYTKIY